MMGGKRLDVKIRSRVELPVSQGFGMSGAGALSTAYALNEAMNMQISKEELTRIAHIAEVEAMTGLGDVYPQSLGGMETRLRPGAPPWGEVRRKAGKNEIILCVLGKELETKDVLRKPAMRRRIAEVGKEYVDEYVRNPSWDNLIEFSCEFAVRTKLASKKILGAIAAVEKLGGKAGMAMLGNSVFAFGDERVKKALRKKGKVFMCRIENEGARLTPPE